MIIVYEQFSKRNSLRWQKYHMLNFNKVIDTTLIASKLNLLLYLKPMRLRRGL